ncbi:hypothetical protein BGZ83_007882 [Gryganskiella cystojenkinii]|nr:hypothetical protein BGZ83_007882 [Gryganskiella cystojenkinii]
MLGDPATMRRPKMSLNPIQRLRNARLPLLRHALIVMCVLSAMLLGLYMTYEQVVSGRDTGKPVPSDYKQLANWPNCPISANAEDICIHVGMNVSELVNICGTLKASIGHCQDRFYGLIVAPQQMMESVSEHTLSMVVHGSGIGGDLDAFVQKKSIWVIDIMGVGGYEILTSFAEKDRREIQQDLDQHQNRCERFFNGASSPHGFGSTWHNLGLGLAYSLFYDMTLLTPDIHNFFINVTTCTETDMERSFAAHPPETNFELWDNSTINFKSGGMDVDNLFPKNRVILPKYEPNGYFWWRSMLTYYAVRPNAHMREIFRKERMFPTPCISIHVRHSDKFKEATLLGFWEYMEAADRLKAKTGISDIYLMTDDDQVIQSTKNYTDYRFHYRTQSRTNQGWIADTEAGVPRDEQELNFLLDIYSAAMCKHSVVTYSSNVGRLIGEIAYATRNIDPDVVSLDGDWRMEP